MNSLEEDIFNNNLEKVQCYFDEHKPLEYTDYSDYNILKKAIRCCKKEMILLLVNNGFRVNKSRSLEYERTLLHIAVDLGCPDILQILLNAGASVDAKNRNNETPIVIAFRSRKELLVDLMLPFTKKNQISIEGLSHMHVACGRNKTDLVKKFLQSGAIIDHAVNSHALGSYAGFTPLHFAVDSQSMEAVKLLVDCGANITALNARRLSPVHLAYRFQNFELLQVLLSAHTYYGANPVNPEGLSHFHIACTVNDSCVVEGFLQRGVDVNVQVPLDSFNYPGFTPLHFAVEQSNLSVVRLLLMNDADVKLMDKREISPLKLASLLDDTEALNLIREQEEMKKMHPKNCRPLSELHQACLQDHLSAALVVIVAIDEVKRNGESIDSCIDPLSPSWPGCTALHLAVIHKNPEVVGLLLDNGAKITAKDARGLTPLHIAFRNHQKDIIETILSNKRFEMANPTDSSGLSHLHILCTATGDYQFDDLEFVSNKLRSMDTELEFLNVPVKSLVKKTYFSKILTFIKGHVDELGNSVSPESDFWPGYNPLHFAIKFQALDIVSALLGNEKFSKNIDITKKNGLGQTPLDLALDCMSQSKNMAAENIFFEIIKLILMTQSRKQHQDFVSRGFSLLHIACVQNAKLDAHKALRTCEIGKAVDLDSPCWAGYTALHFAIRFLRLDIAQLLIDRGANPNVRNAQGDTPLHLLFRFSAEIGFSVNGIDASTPQTNLLRMLEHSPLWQVPEANMERLLVYNFRNNDAEGEASGSNKEHNIMEDERWLQASQLLDILLSAGADPNVRNLLGETATHVAARRESGQCLFDRLLLAGADLNAQYDDGGTPLAELLLHAGNRSQRYTWYESALKRLKALDLLGKPMCERNKRFAAQIQGELVDNHGFNEAALEARCREEIDSMTQIIVARGLNLRDILELDIDVLAPLVRSPELWDIMNSSDFDEKYQNYGSMLKLQFHKASRRRNLLEDAESVLYKLNLPQVCTAKIARYLCDDDLRSLVWSSKRQC
ncbi:hypothetical protein QAD02_023697 [Eretmocerus hayati]|uniref:Uncharacterized protein n=1 Tax=Eretmocerus hayati TaxID=131215 RepID=A0ACC2PX04_9HYME|nr:hypothetical protein QAD02_023697 [Eretmocerus hayati]